jgi:hypothetical protein
VDLNTTRRKVVDTSSLFLLIAVITTTITGLVDMMTTITGLVGMMTTTTAHVDMTMTIIARIVMIATMANARVIRDSVPAVTEQEIIKKWMCPGGIYHRYITIRSCWAWCGVFHSHAPHSKTSPAVGRSKRLTAGPLPRTRPHQDIYAPTQGKSLRK